jgi:hypothetical protein
MHLLVAPFVFIGFTASVLNRRIRSKLSKSDPYTITISSLIFVDSSQKQEFFDGEESEVFEENTLKTKVREIF